jgi:hypothetical protein
MILLALLIFTVFSIVCGAATGMTELSIPSSSLKAHKLIKAVLSSEHSKA